MHIYHQADMKNVVKWWKDFLLYFTTQETYTGPRIMRFHLVQYSTSARSRENQQIYTLSEFIQQVRTIHLVQESALSE